MRPDLPWQARPACVSSLRSRGSLVVAPADLCAGSVPAIRARSSVDRASRFEREGREFDTLRARQSRFSRGASAARQGPPVGPACSAAIEGGFVRNLRHQVGGPWPRRTEIRSPGPRHRSVLRESFPQAAAGFPPPGSIDADTVGGRQAASPQTDGLIPGYLPCLPATWPGCQRPISSMASAQADARRCRCTGAAVRSGAQTGVGAMEGLRVEALRCAIPLDLPSEITLLPTAGAGDTVQSDSGGAIGAAAIRQGATERRNSRP